MLPLTVFTFHQPWSTCQLRWCSSLFSLFISSRTLQQFTSILILDHDLGRIKCPDHHGPAFTLLVNFKNQCWCLPAPNPGTFGFLFELGVIAQLYCRTTLCIDHLHSSSELPPEPQGSMWYHRRRREQFLWNTMVPPESSSRIFKHFHVAGHSSVLLCFYHNNAGCLSFWNRTPSSFILSNDW